MLYMYADLWNDLIYKTKRESILCHCIFIDIDPGAYMYHKLLLAILIHVLFLTPLNTAGGPKCVASTKYHRSEYELSNSRADNYKQISKCWWSEIKYNVKVQDKGYKSLLKFASNFLWSMHEYGYTVNKALEQPHTRSIHLIHMYFIRAWTKLSLIRACTPWYCDAHSYTLQTLL